MAATLEALAASHETCKCCGEAAPLFGVVDFHKNCEQRRNPDVLSLSGIPIFYHRCRDCGFLFTTAFDAFTGDDFSHHIYNDEYRRVDPDFDEVRPTGNAQLLTGLLADHKSLSILDYGGGNGLLAKRLRKAGFRNVDTYDPFVARHAKRPTRRYRCIVAFEVVEHAPDPRGTFDDMLSFLADDGLILFSTLVQPPNIESLGLGWWYVGPRNGHVSLHTKKSLLSLLKPRGIQFGSFNDGLHALFHEIPGFARPFMGGAA